MTAVSGRVNIAVDLRSPTEVTPAQGLTLTVSRVSFWVDEPRDVARVLRDRATRHAGRRH